MACSNLESGGCLSDDSILAYSFILPFIAFFLPKLGFSSKKNQYLLSKLYLAHFRSMLHEIGS